MAGIPSLNVLEAKTAADRDTGEYVANNDSPPLSGQLLTNSLPPLYQLEDERTVTLLETPGIYQIYVAVYRQSDGIRLDVNNSAETLVPIGVIQVE